MGKVSLPGGSGGGGGGRLVRRGQVVIRVAGSTSNDNGLLLSLFVDITQPDPWNLAFLRSTVQGNAPHFSIDPNTRHVNCQYDNRHGDTDTLGELKVLLNSITPPGQLPFLVADYLGTAVRATVPEQPPVTRIFRAFSDMDVVGGSVFNIEQLGALADNMTLAGAGRPGDALHVRDQGITRQQLGRDFNVLPQIQSSDQGRLVKVKDSLAGQSEPVEYLAPSSVVGPVLGNAPALTTVADDDELPILDTGSGGALRKITRANLVAGLSGGGSTPSTSDARAWYAADLTQVPVSPTPGDTLVVLADFGRQSTVTTGPSSARVDFESGDIFIASGDPTTGWALVHRQASGVSLTGATLSLNTWDAASGAGTVTVDLSSLTAGLQGAISGLTQTNPATGDSIAFSDVSDSGNAKRATLQQVANLIGSGTVHAFEIDPLTAATPALTDEVAFADASDSDAMRKTTLSDVRNLMTDGFETKIGSQASATPTGADVLAFQDVSASNATRTATINAVGTVINDVLGLTAATPALGDNLAFADVSDSNARRRMTLTQLQTLIGGGSGFNINALTEVNPATADEVPLADASDTGSPKKTTLTKLRTLMQAGVLPDIDTLTTATPQLADSIAFADSSAADGPKKATLTALQTVLTAGLQTNIRGLTQAAPALGDYFAFQDVSDLNNIRKGTLTQLQSLIGSAFNISGLTAATPALNDEIAMADVSDSNAQRKITLEELRDLISSELPAAPSAVAQAKKYELGVAADGTVSWIEANTGTPPASTVTIYFGNVAALASITGITSLPLTTSPTTSSQALTVGQSTVITMPASVANTYSWWLTPEAVHISAISDILFSGDFVGSLTRQPDLSLGSPASTWRLWTYGPSVAAQPNGEQLNITIAT